MSTAGLPPRVRLLTRTGCHLCDDAREALVPLCAARGVGLEEVDVDADPELAREYSDYVPVVFVDGAVVGWLQVDEQAVAAALTAPSR